MCQSLLKCDIFLRSVFLKRNSFTVQKLQSWQGPMHKSFFSRWKKDKFAAKRWNANHTYKLHLGHDKAKERERRVAEVKIMSPGLFSHRRKFLFKKRQVLSKIILRAKLDLRGHLASCLFISLSLFIFCGPVWFHASLPVSLSTRLTPTWRLCQALVTLGYKSSFAPRYHHHPEVSS